jgi:hypothetical protein
MSSLSGQAKIKRMATALCDSAKRASPRQPLVRTKPRGVLGTVAEDHAAERRQSEIVRAGATLIKIYIRMAPEVGFEPTTNRLTADRSTTELLRNPEFRERTS